MYLVVEKCYLNADFFAVKVTGCDVKARMDVLKAQTSHLLDKFLEEGIPITIVQMYEILWKTCNSQLQTRFSSKRIPTLTSHPVTLTVKKSMKITFSKKRYITFFLRRL